MIRINNRYLCWMGSVMKDFENIDPENIEKVEIFKDPDSEVAKKYNAKMV